MKAKYVYCLVGTYLHDPAEIGIVTSSYQKAKRALKNQIEYKKKEFPSQSSSNLDPHWRIEAIQPGQLHRVSSIPRCML